MINQGIEILSELMVRGGWVMYPLLALSAIAFTMIFERAWFWLGTNRPGRMNNVQTMGERMRRGDMTGALALAKRDSSVYGRSVLILVAEATEAGKGDASVGLIDDAVAAEVLESQRGRIERFMPMLSTIITAAPLMGILGTVTGIIDSFALLSETAAQTDPRAVSGGIAEALLTTAAGLVVALFVLFPYNWYRAQIDRTLGRLETLVAAAARAGKQSAPSTPGKPVATSTTPTPSS